MDEYQLSWFEEQLNASQGRPVIIFTHAPPLGCGLKVVEVRRKRVTTYLTLQIESAKILLRPSHTLLSISEPLGMKWWNLSHGSFLS